MSLLDLFSTKDVITSDAPVNPQTGQPQTPSPTAAPFPTEDPSKVNPILKQDMEVLSHLDPRTTQLITQAAQDTKNAHIALIEPEQILLTLLTDREVAKLLQNVNIDIAQTTRELQGKIQPGTFSGEPTLSEGSKQLLEKAYQQAKERKVEFVTPEDILLALADSDNAISADLKNKGLEKGKLAEKLSTSPEFKTGKKSALKEFGTDLTQAAIEGKLDPVAGREEETRRLIHILIRRTKNNPIVIGEAGTGKTAVVEGLAQLIAQKKVPQELQNRRIIQLEVSSLVAGASHRGEFEERLQNVIKEVMASSGTYILFIDEIHTIIGAGETGGALDASNILKPYLARGQMQVIGATTTAEFRRYFEKDRAFERRFQSVVCEEPNEEQTLKMLQVLQPKLESFHKVTFSPEALTSAIKLSKRYIGERFLPDKAIDLLDEAASELRLQKADSARSDNQVKPADIEKIVSAWTGIPIAKLTEKESDKLLHMEELIHKKYINHDRAVKAVAEAVRRGRIGLANMNRPIASFIFLGPTGTGKTEIAKVLAEIMFGSANNMIRLDMSEYMEKHEVAKLIGAPPGYVGYEEGGQLTEAVRKKPFSIVLLDEIEKAHPDVFNIALQLLDDGRLTDNKGNTVSFKNTIIIATSNVGSNLIRDFIQKTQDEKQAQSTQADQFLKATETPQFYQGAQAATPPTNNPEAGHDAANGQLKNNSLFAEQRSSASFAGTADPKADQNFRKLSKIVIDELNKFFRPEFLNRFDEIVIFEPLSQENMAEIAKLGIDSTRKMLKEQNVSLQVSQAALNQLAKEGYDPVYGARPLRRLIQRSIENPIAIYLIQKTVTFGDTMIVDYDASKDKFIFNKSNTSPNIANVSTSVSVEPISGIQNPPPSQPPAQPGGVITSLPDATVEQQPK